MTAAQFDVVGFIMKVESEGFDHEDQTDVDTLQHMIDTKLVWQLQGFWHRFAKAMIDAGIVKWPGPNETA